MADWLERLRPRQPDRFDKFTERARRVTTSFAQEEAQRFSDPYIDTEHFLLGLVRERDSLAAKVIINLGVDLLTVRTTVEELMVGRSPIDAVGLTPAGKNVIELSVEEARRLNHHFIGTEHLLLGLRRENKGLAARALDKLELTLEKLRGETERILSQSGPYAHLRSQTVELHPIISTLDQWRNLLLHPNTDQLGRDKYVGLLNDLLNQAKNEQDNPQGPPPTA